MAFKVPEKYRFQPSIGRLQSRPSDGNNGAFRIPLSGRSIAICIVADGGGWEHVSVHIRIEAGNKVGMSTPTWAQMCRIKDMFWDEEDCVVQYHPPKSDYVNNHPHVLHLWRKIGHNFERPPKEFVGTI